MDTIIATLQEKDIDPIVDAFKKLGWNKPRMLFENYLFEQAKDARAVFVATSEGNFCGYITVKWLSEYPSFARHQIPEIVDLNVLPSCRKQGIGTKLIETCQQLAIDRNHRVMGIGVGMSEDYGSAQRLYVTLGFVPDGRGLHYQCLPLAFGNTVTLDDDLVLYFTKKLF